MKYICLGYIEEGVWEKMSESEQKEFMNNCFAYDDVLRKKGAFVGGEALQSSRTATTLKYRDGKVAVTDGPYAETKEQLGGIMILEATDLNHAIELMSKHPSLPLGGGSWEIRPADEQVNALVEERSGNKSTR